MVSKAFEDVVQFSEVVTTEGLLSYPFVTIRIIRDDGSRAAIVVLFDTGADTTTLRVELAPLLGISSLQDGQPVTIATAGGEVTMYRFSARLEVFAKDIECPILLRDLPKHPVCQGYLGREGLFEHFGFGFWEKDRELLVTTQP